MSTPTEEEEALLQQIMNAAPLRLRLTNRSGRRRTRLRATGNDQAMLLESSVLLQQQPIKYPPLFFGCIIAVSNCEDSVKQTILENCTLCASKVQNVYSSECTHLITPFQKGIEFEQAMMEQKIVASVQWLEDVMTSRHYFAPYKPLVHFPVPDAGGIEEMKNLVCL